MSDQDTKQHPQENADLNDPRVKFVAEVLEKIRSLLLHDTTQPPIHRVQSYYSPASEAALMTDGRQNLM